MENNFKKVKKKKKKKNFYIINIKYIYLILNSSPMIVRNFLIVKIKKYYFLK